MPDDHVEALRSWGCRLDLAVRDALAASSSIEVGVGCRHPHIDAIRSHFGLGGAHHSLHVEPLRWLRLGETQATKGIRHFLDGSHSRIRLLLEALAPTIAWPPDLTDLSIVAEAPSGRGRMDLLIQGRAQGQVWGAIVEAKFEHGLKSNPLDEYKRHGARLRMSLTTTAIEARTGALIVLGTKLSRQTRKKMKYNRRWSFVHWHEVLRRFDAALDEPVVDDDFRRFRRTLWDRTGSAV